jgi:hypothetical protein
MEYKGIDIFHELIRFYENDRFLISNSLFSNFYFHGNMANMI